MNGRPMEGVRVLEVAQMVAGPGAGLLLADYGAEVIKIEPPGGDGARQLRSPTVAGVDPSPVFTAYNRNKRLVRADLRDAADRDAVLELARTADVFLTSSRPGVMERLGLGFDELSELNPGIVYAAVTGFGSGPLGAARGGVDILVQAESGLMSTTGEVGGQPLKVGFTIVDAAAAHSVTHGVLAALLRRSRTGVGAKVEVSLYDVALNLQTGPLAEFLHSGVQLPRMGNAAPLSAPADLFPCLDGHIVISAYLPHHWRALLECLDLPHLATDPRFATGTARTEHRGELYELLAERFATRPAADWFSELTGRGLLAAPVNDHAAVVASPQTREAQMIFESGDVKGVASPNKVDGERGGPEEPVQITSIRDARWGGRE